jgi:hypothetical protein
VPARIVAVSTLRSADVVTEATAAVLAEIDRRIDSVTRVWETKLLATLDALERFSEDVLEREPDVDRMRREFRRLADAHAHACRDVIAAAKDVGAHDVFDPLRAASVDIRLSGQ